MRLPQDKLGKIKNYVHAGQGVIIAIAWLMCIIIFTRDGDSDGRIGWYFALVSQQAVAVNGAMADHVFLQCWLTIPILVYLVMVPMFSRSRRFSNMYAFAALDVISIILWLSAWASMASYVSGGKGKGDNKDKDKTGCDNFAFGSPARCKISQGIIILGVILMLAFAGTAFLSVKAAMHFRRTGEAPDAGMGNDNLAKQTQDAFSSNMRNNDPFDDNQEDVDARQGGQAGYGPARRSEEDEYAPLQYNDPDDVSQVQPTQPAGPLAYAGQSGGVIHDYDTSYHGAYGRPAPDSDYANPSYGR